MKLNLEHYKEQMGKNPLVRAGGIIGTESWIKDGEAHSKSVVNANSVEFATFDKDNKIEWKNMLAPKREASKTASVDKKASATSSIAEEKVSNQPSPAVSSTVDNQIIQQQAQTQMQNQAQANSQGYGMSMGL
jgi:hypothetical protein